jgi:hypothetical protein
MARYAIGVVQGCFDALQTLLQKIRFDPARDHLWFTGDLVNRGPRSVDVLRFVKDLGERAITVLGNHDLHLLAVASGAASLGPRDTLTDVLEAADRDQLLDWIASRPLLHHDPRIRFCDPHTGALDFDHKGAPGSQPEPLRPWFELPWRHSQGTHVIFGHWSTLDVYSSSDVTGIDTGCAWGRRLTAICLSDKERRLVSIPCQAAAQGPRAGR